jgi:DNA-binding transcriptional ArsR family regulator
MLARLATGPAIVRELAEPFDMTIPAVSKHLRVLERAMLVERTVDGRVHRCELNADALSDLDRWAAFYRRFWDGTLDELARYAESDA